MKTLMLPLSLMLVLFSLSNASATQNRDREFVHMQNLRDRSIAAENADARTVDEGSEHMRSLQQGKPRSWEPPSMHR